ncbi:MAG TPA: ABC transporter ATP-binding protein [Mycobacteriales bacterium]|nr:ABC transporter ATP-binding protein [Mycobacteriales bacterium]
MAVIEVHELRKRYGDTAALDGISLEVQAGEVFGLLGPNGAGKTTAVEIIEGLRTADSGTVRVLGLDPATDGPQLRERVGVQLQQAQLPEKMAVGEALELYAGFYRHPRPVPELLAEWGLAGKRTARFRTLSGGQKQRLFLALALVGDPELVFFDEITTGLDPAARRQAWELVRRVRAQGVTVVLVSHLMDEAEELCDRVAIVDRGRVVALDTPTALIDRSGSERRMRFRPPGPLPAGLVEAVPGVTGVARSGSQVLVTGTGDFATGVTAVLAREHVLVADLRLEQRTLDDAFLALTGRPMDDDELEAVPADRRTTKKPEAVPADRRTTKKPEVR